MSAKKSKSNNNDNSLDPDTLEAFHEALEDVATRFIVNLPHEELTSPARLFFQLEQAWWYYEDFICDDMGEHETEPQESKPRSYADAAAKVSLPRFKKMQPFCRKLFEASPLLSPLISQFDALWAQFSKYRRKISTYGTILLNQQCTKVVLCQDYNSKSWTFPAGKVNQNEHGIECSARETYEETGFDPNCNIGLSKQMKLDSNTSGLGELPWKDLQKEDVLTFTEDAIGKSRTCYVCHGVPEDFPFAPVARKEVSAVEWHDLRDLPKKSFAVVPFISGLKNWIRKNKPKDRSSSRVKDKRSASNKKAKRAGSKHRGSRHSTPAKSVISSDADEDLILSGLGNVGDDNRWSEDDMFKVNEQMIGRKVDYDGNPQIFAQKGFDGVDPHAFRVVHGGFMNSGKSEIANAPDKDKMQPLYRANEDVDDDGFTPFFANDSESADALADFDTVSSKPNQDVEIPRSRKKKSKMKSRSNTTSPADLRDEESSASKKNGSITNASGLAILSMLRGSSPSQERATRTIPAVDDNSNTNDLDVFMTDGDITKNSQSVKSRALSEEKTSEDQYQTSDKEPQESKHLKALHTWVENLPRTKPTELFGDFHFNVDAIMAAMIKK